MSMSEKAIRVLVVDDDAAMRSVLTEELSGRGFNVATVASGNDALTRFESEAFDVVLTDIAMQGMSGVDLCAKVAASARSVPVVVMTAFGSMETAIAAIRAGAWDYVTKPFAGEALAMTLDRAASDRALREEARRLRLAAGIDTPGFQGMIGESRAMTRVYDLVTRVAPGETTVLITGESGSGKELVAKAVHARSSRSGGPFVAINCAAMPEHLLESELFGHVKGAFTDARQSRPGLFIKASGGTLFLDEIGEMPAGMQAKLLRALQERTVRAVGGDTEMRFDTRILAATNRDLDAEVLAKRFREDLFYRINVVRIAVPPLRDRGRDVLVLAHHLMMRAQATTPRGVIGFSRGVVEALIAHAWPGNVRELQNCIERAVALAEFDHLRVEDLSEKVREQKNAGLGLESNDSAELVTMDEVERRYIVRVLEAVAGNKTVAAKVLGFDRRTLFASSTR
jgi:DNA-binding NtrC family response regulator